VIEKPPKNPRIAFLPTSGRATARPGAAAPASRKATVHAMALKGSCTGRWPTGATKVGAPIVIVWRALFDDRFDSLMEDHRRGVASHLVSPLIFTAALGINTNWKTAALWGAATAATVVLGHIFKASPQAGLARRVSSGLACLATIALWSLLWTMAAVIFWFTSEPGLRITSIVLLISLLSLAYSASFRSRAVLVASGTLPAATVLLLPMGLGGYSPRVTVSVALALLAAAFYFVRAVQRSEENARALRGAQEALRAETARAVAANNAKSAFLAVTSHELRTPMNGVLGMAHALTLTKLSRQQAGYVDMLVRSGKALMTILNDILDISKIEAGKLELESIAFDLHDLTRQVHGTWQETARAKGVRLICEVDPEVPQWVSGDVARLRQIMQNLVSNALKFTQEGEVRLSVSADRSDDPAGLRIVVSDTGAGMSEAQQARLFQSFMQADRSTARRYGGTGLGLAICKQLVGLMDGEIGVHSRPDEGSSFWVSLRLPAAAPAQDDPQEVEVADLDGCSVLVADDNAINQAVARAILEAVGATISTASDGQEALERLKSESFDLVLMDIQMPRMGGIEAVNCIRAGQAGRRDIPVIALTADAMAGVDAELLAQGFDDVAPKPINPADLIAVVQRHGIPTQRDPGPRAIATAS